VGERRLGLPFDQALLDTISAASPAAGINYEQNRQRVLDMRAKGIPVPAWRSDKVKPFAVKVATAALSALRKRRGEPAANPTYRQGAIA
jgi:hypothetical protein